MKKKEKTQNLKKTPSRSLEVVSEVPNKEETGSIDRRRLPRLRLSAGQFRLGQNGKVFSVSNLSESGMALGILEKSDQVLFPVGALLKGTLNLRGEKLNLEARVKHIAPRDIGCEFENLGQDSKEALIKFFDPETLGKEIKAIPSSEPNTDWYHGSSGTDILIRKAADGDYLQMTLYVMGIFIQWDKAAGITTGQTQLGQDSGEEWGLLHFQTMILKRDAEPDPSKMGIAKTVILSSNLQSEVPKKWLKKFIGSLGGP